MTPNKRDLKAYSRFDGTGRIVPGSTVLRRSKPKVGKWKQVQAYECCESSPSCVIMQGIPEEGVYGFTLGTKNGGSNVKGVVRWTQGEEQTFNLPADGSDYDFFYNYGDQLPHTIELCVNNPSQIQDFELGFGPGDTVSLNNAQGLSGVDEWDSDEMNIYSLDLSNMIGLTELFHCCSILTHINITGSVSLIDVDLSDNALTQASVDHVLITLDNNDLINGTVDVSGGTNSTPSTAGVDAYSNLVVKGWTVNTN